MRRPPLTTPSCSAGCRWPQERVWAGRTAGTSPPGWNRRVRRPPRPGVLGGQAAGPPPRAPGCRAHPWTSNRLGWQLHQLDPTWNRRPAGDPAQASATAPHGSRRPPRRRPGLHYLPAQVAAIGSLTAQLGQLDRERCQRVTRSAPNLLAWPGGGTLTAAKPSSSPRPPPWPGPRQLRSPAPVADGNRQLHAVALHRIAITRLRLPGPPRPTTSGAAPRMTSPARPCPPLRRRIVRAVYRRHLKQAQQPSTTAAHGRAEEQPTPRAAR